MSFVFTKITVVYVSVSIVSYTPSMHLAVSELALILAEVRPLHYSLALKLIFNKLAYIYFSTVCKVILSIAMELALDKIAFISGSLEFEFSLACLLTLLEVSLISDAIKVPELETSPVLHVVSPLSGVQASIIIAESALAMSLAILPLALIHIAVGMRHPAHAMEKTVLGLSLVLRFIRKDYGSKSTPLNPCS